MSNTFVADMLIAKEYSDKIRGCYLSADLYAIYYEDERAEMWLTYIRNEWNEMHRLWDEGIGKCKDFVAQSCIDNQFKRFTEAFPLKGLW